MNNIFRLRPCPNCGNKNITYKTAAFAGDGEPITGYRRCCTNECHRLSSKTPIYYPTLDAADKAWGLVGANMTYIEAAFVLDHPTEHWDELNREWDDEMVEALDMLAGLLLEAAEKEQAK